jgi:hypothetical protein
MGRIALLKGYFDDDGQLLGFVNDDRAISQVGAVVVVGQSAGAVSVTGTTAETILATVTIPPGLLGPAGQIRFSSRWTWTNSSNQKTRRIRFAGALAGIVDAGPATNSSTSWDWFHGCNQGVGQQLWLSAFTDSPFYANNLSGYGPSLTSAADTRQAQPLTITGQLASAGETLTLESYLVEVFPTAG